MLKQYISKLVNKENLSVNEVKQIVNIMEEGIISPAQIAAFLTALKMKGETPEEITGFALSLRKKAISINTQGITDIVDSCGTGGDCSNTFNISTTCAIIAAASGLNVAKHSNFGFTSQCGSSNVIEALGIKLVKTAEEAEKSLRNHNITFIHAPYFHKCTSHVNPVRKEIGIRTIFNFLGPLSNPTNPTGQVLGVPCSKIAPKIAETLNNLGCKKAMIVHGQNPILDEISICGKTLVYKLEKGAIEQIELHPQDFGFKISSLNEILGGSPQENAQIIENVLSGKCFDARFDTVLLNTGALLWVGNKVDSIEKGIDLAKELILSGKAAKKLQELKG